MSLSRRQARRQALVLLYQWDLTGQEFGVQQRSNDLELLWSHPPGDGVHARAPAPEIVPGATQVAPLALGQARYGALKSVAMGIDQTRQHGTVKHSGSGAIHQRRVRRDAAPVACRIDRQENVSHPGPLDPGPRGKEMRGVTVHGQPDKWPARSEADF